MKKIKLSSQPLSQPDSPFPVSSSSQIPKKKNLLFFPTATISSKYIHNLGNISTNLCVKNYHFFEIHCNNKSSTTKIFRRNAKYLKGTQEYRFKSSPSVEMYKLANKMERIPLGFAKFSHCVSGTNFAFMRGDIFEFFEVVAKNRLTKKTIQITIPLLNNNDALMNFYEKQLQRMLRTSLSNLSCEHEINQQNDAFQNLKILNNIKFLTNLQSITLKLDIKGGKPETFYQAFEALSDIPKLEVLKISMGFSEVDTKGKNMKKIIAKFDSLKYLDLQLPFETNVPANNKILVSLASFKSLRYLKLGVFPKSEFSRMLNIHYSDAIKFVVAQKNLETFKFKVYYMRFDEYLELFQGVQKMKSLTKLCVVQMSRRYEMPFGYGIVFKLLGALKKLKKFHLHLGTYGCDGEEMSAIFRHLLKHPTLKSLNICLKMDPKSNQSYKFDEEFYENIRELKKKLNYGFKFYFIFFNVPQYIQVYEKISKIINPSGLENELFICSKRFC